MARKVFINTSDLMGPGWRFLEDRCDDPGIAWEIHSGLPAGRLERALRHPLPARLRAAWQAAHSARRRPGAVLVSHLPRMAAATNAMRRALCADVPQVAFAFNFTDLPVGWRRRLMVRAFRGISEFVVFSRFEKELYGGYFGIDPDRIRFLPWAMDPPAPGPENPAGGGDYVSAVGGEARDYALLARAMARLPGIRAVIVARPSSLAGIDLPANVTAFTNLPAPQTWRIAADSLGMIVPLRTDRTACGHITMIGAQLLGLPVVVTRSAGIVDYAREGENAVLVPAGDEDALAAAVARLVDERAAMRELGREAGAIAARENALAVWVDYFRGLASRWALR